MQENVKKRPEHQADEVNGTGKIGAKRILRSIGKELLRGAGAFLFGQAALLFGTSPLGVALLCAVNGRIFPVLAGLILSAGLTQEHPVLYIAAYLAAALIRVGASLLSDAPGGRAVLPERIRDKLRAKQMKDGHATVEAETVAGSDASEKAKTEKSEKNVPSRLSVLIGRLRESAGVGILRVLREELRDVFTESVLLRMATAAVCMLLISLWRIIAGGFRYYDLFAAIFCVLVAPAAVLVWSVFLEARRELRILYTVSAATLLFSLIWAAAPLSLYGVPIAALFAMFFTLLITNRRGVLWGAFGAILCGAAFAPIQIPAFLIAALIYALLHRQDKQTVGIPAACLCGLSWSVYVAGMQILPGYLIADLAAGACFSFYLLLTKEQPETEAGTTEKQPSDTETKLRYVTTRLGDSNDRFRGISDAFSTLSEMFYNLSDRLRRPGTLDLRRICDNAFDRVCPDCPNKNVCWGLEYTETLEAVNKLACGLHKHGKVNEGMIPSRLRHRCPSLEEIVESVNGGCARLTGELLRDNRTEIFAMDYEAAASIINDALEEDDGEYRMDAELSAQVADYLSDAGVTAQSVTVYGNRRRQIFVRGAEIDRATVSAETMCADLGEMCGLELTNPVFEVDDNVSTMILQAKKRISVTGAQNNLSADGGVSGDSVNLFSNKKDYFYALISDGMGSGKEAALTSNLCSVFLEKMLRAGNRAGTSLRMLNNMILSRTQNSAAECSSTIDLLELDLITGVATFMKSGAAPSFVVRGGAVNRIQSGSAPIGIIRRLDSQSTSFPLRPGDTVVMISDGIQQNDADCEWLTDFLRDAAGKEPEEIVYRICLHASSCESHDDCSAIALRIEEA